MNDILSQQTADELFFSIKEHLGAALNERYGIGKTLRITASHNKLTLALPKETTLPLPAQEEIDALVQKAIAAKQEVLLESMERFQKSKFEVAEAIKEIQVTCGESQVASPG